MRILFILHIRDKEATIFFSLVSYISSHFRIYRCVIIVLRFFFLIVGIDCLFVFIFSLSVSHFFFCYSSCFVLNVLHVCLSLLNLHIGLNSMKFYGPVLLQFIHFDKCDRICSVIFELLNKIVHQKR